MDNVYDILIALTIAVLGWVAIEVIKDLATKKTSVLTDAERRQLERVDDLRQSIDRLAERIDRLYDIIMRRD